MDDAVWGSVPTRGKQLKQMKQLIINHLIWPKLLALYDLKLSSTEDIWPNLVSALALCTGLQQTRMREV